MTIGQNDVTAIGAASAQTSIVELKGDFNLDISGTWAGTITILKRRPIFNAIGIQDGGDGQAAFTDSTLAKPSATLIVADELIGKYITNDTDGSIGPITDNTATVITATLAGGSQNDWDDGEGASIWDVVSTFTAKQELVGTAPEGGASYMAVFSTFSSGTAHVILSQ